jgi:cytosine permease
MTVNDDFAFEPVPDNNTVSGLRIALVLTGIIIALPSFIIGANLGATLGFRRGALAIIFGGLVLTAIAFATGTVGARTRLTTAMIARQTFGTFGGRIVSGILAIACLGWFGVTAEVFGQSIHEILLTLDWDYLPRSAYIVLGGLFMVVTTLFGFTALQRLSTVTVPLLALLITYTAVIAMRGSPSSAALLGSGSNDTGLGDGVSAIVGSLAVAVTIFPDLCRFSQRPRDAWLAALLTYAVAMPVILMLAMIPSIIMHERNLIIIMTTLGLGIPALGLLVVKAWATNSGNLYVASLSAANLLSSRRQKLIIASAGCLGTLVAVLGVTERLVPFLVALGVSIPPVAGLYVADFWTRRVSYDHKRIPPALNIPAFGCWLFGIAIAVAARAGVLALSSVSAIDSMLVAAGSYLIWQRVWPSSSLRDQKPPTVTATRG